MEHHLTETHEHDFEIHNIALSPQSLSLIIVCIQHLAGSACANFEVTRMVDSDGVRTDTADRYIGVEFNTSDHCPSRCS